MPTKTKKDGLTLGKGGSWEAGSSEEAGFSNLTSPH